MGPLIATRPARSFGFHSASRSRLRQTFSPVVKPATVRTMLATAVSRDWPIQQLDVKNVFLCGTLSETVFCCQPTSFTDTAHPTLVCRLRKSLYGLKQALRAWCSRFATYLTTLGFIEAKSDTSLFIFRRGSDTVYLLLYVDDIILTASSTELLRRTISALQREFAMRDLGPLHHFLGITVERRPDGLFLHQRPTCSTSSSVRSWRIASRARLQSIYRQSWLGTQGPLSRTHLSSGALQKLSNT
jgi:hypothetical protein